MATDKTILIVDDDLNLRKSLALILQHAGYAITSASSGEEALKHLRQCQFDLVFLDLKMPDGDGLSVLPAIRRLYPEMPVLVLTSASIHESRKEVMKLGARGYLVKPIDPPNLIENVEMVLSGH